MDSLHSLLNDKAQQLDELHGNDLSLARHELERLFPGQITSIALKDDQLLLSTPHSAIASELRLTQVQILATLRSSLKQPPQKIRIFIR
jgi:hypothetical protein